MRGSFPLRPSLLFYEPEEGWSGTGAYRDAGHNARIRQSLCALLDAVGGRSAVRAALEDGTFSFATRSSMLGRQAFSVAVADKDLGEALADLVYEDEDAYLLGLGWLRSLDGEKTADAVTLTMEWLLPLAQQPTLRNPFEGENDGRPI
jgi:hypothetical protein